MLPFRPLLRLSFLGRFVLVFCVFSACVFCVYVAEQIIFYAPAPAVPAYDIAPQLSAAQAAQNRQAERRQAESSAADKAARAEQTAANRPAAADEARGRRIFARCAVCHTANKGGANRVGPNLWNIAARPIAGLSDFHYSAAMRAFAAQQKNWNLALLDKFLAAPAAYIKGTIMVYPGAKDSQERADLLLYLESLADKADE